MQSYQEIKLKCSWHLKENFYNDNLVTDVGDISYTSREQKLKAFKQITEPFCDNIMLVKQILQILQKEKLLLKPEIS